MKALVINLAKATDRMVFQTQQLKDLGIEFKRLPAVSISDINDGIYQKYYSTWERPLRESEVACFLSHKNAWEEVIKTNAPLLVLEDDAFLSQTVPCVLESLEKLHNVDYVTLEVRGRKKILSKKVSYKFCETSLLYLYQDRTGAAGYVLWPSGAKKLIERFENGKIALADAFISSTYSLQSYQIEPAIIIQLDQCDGYGISPPLDTESAISSEDKPLAKASRKFSYRFKRIIGQLRMAGRHISVVHKSRRKDVQLVHKKYFETKG